MGVSNLGFLRQTLSAYRLCWIGGRFGGYKTSVAYALAEPYLKDGYRLVSNNYSIWSDAPEDVKLNKDGVLKCVIILDEGGREFKQSRQIEMIASLARKMDVIYLIPSFWAPTRAAQVLTIQPLFNFVGAGLPLVYYKWMVKLGGFKDAGSFMFSFPEMVFGVYSSMDSAEASTEIISWIIERTMEYTERQGRSTNVVSKVGVEVSEADVLSDAVSTLAETVDSWQALPERKSSRRGIFRK